MSSDSKNNDDNDKEEPTTASTSSTTDPPLKIVPDCWDDPAAVPTTTKASETIEEAVEEVKKEQLEPGDHVTRWEMLPIAWPIQVHGIVLNVHEGTVVLVDFGLSAPPVDKATKKASTSPTSPTSSSEEATISNTKKVEHAIRNFKIGGKKPEKNRLNINVLSNPKDIAKWKRVNYESGWFGGGGSKKNSKSKSNNKKKSNSNDEDGTSPTKAQRTKQWFSKMATSVKEKTRPGLDSLKEKATSMRGALHNHHQQQTESDNISTTSSTGAATETPIPVTEEEEDDDDDVTSVNNNQEKKMIQPSESQDSSASLHPSTSMVSDGGSSTTSDFSERPVMNSRMKELMQKKQEERPPKTMNPAMAKIMKKKKDEELSLFESKKKKSLAKLPKSDPVKLVLARTHWLLQHGESILPPYHAFSSNSECMAVFCKTGRWNTLQADVFLHSTAIGNAKTMGATTIAVAASAPMLAPAVAVAGIAAVASPWLYLNKQKNKAVDSQQRLTDEFWAQAEPEVFVACIQAWSKDLLGLKEDDDEEDEEKNHHEKDNDDNVKEQETVMDIVAPPAVDVDVPEENAKRGDDVPPTD